MPPSSLTRKPAMKTLALALILATAACAARAQEPVTFIEYGPQALQMHTQNNADIQAALNKLLEKSEKQLDALDSLVKWHGDFSAANKASVESAKDAILANTLTTTKSTQQLMQERASVTGKELFEDSPDGVFKGIGNTFEKKEKDADGNEITVTTDRDPEKYKAEAQKLQDIKEFYRVREEALDKQKALEAARLQAHIDLLKTEDEVETRRLTAQIATLDAELIAIRQDVANANHELEVHEKAVNLQTIADAKAGQEDSGRDPTSMRQKAEAMQDKVKQVIDKMKTDLNNRSSKGRGRLP